MTMNVSRTGALLTGIHEKLRIGTQVSLARAHRREQFLIAWIGEAHTSRSSQIGVTAVNPATSFWNDLTGNLSQGESREEKSSAKTAAKPKARAQGA
jgi:hypothetical protein